MEQTLQSWYTTTHQQLTLADETAKALLLSESYRTVLAYQIYYSSQGRSFTENQLIAQCGKILDNLCWNYRLSF